MDINVLMKNGEFNWFTSKSTWEGVLFSLYPFGFMHNKENIWFNSYEQNCQLMFPAPHGGGFRVVPKLHVAQGQLISNSVFYTILLSCDSHRKSVVCSDFSHSKTCTQYGRYVHLLACTWYVVANTPNVVFWVACPKVLVPQEQIDMGWNVIYTTTGSIEQERKCYKDILSPIWQASPLGFIEIIIWSGL